MQIRLEVVTFSEDTHSSPFMKIVTEQLFFLLIVESAETKRRVALICDTGVRMYAHKCTCVNSSELFNIYEPWLLHLSNGDYL